MRGKNNEDHVAALQLSTSGSPRFLFSNGTYANNATYLATYFGTAFFIALNVVFALALVDDLSRKVKPYEKDHREEDERQRRRHNWRRSGGKKGGGGGYRNWRYFEILKLPVIEFWPSICTPSSMQSIKGFHEFSLPKRFGLRLLKHATPRLNDQLIHETMNVGKVREHSLNLNEPSARTRAHIHLTEPTDRSIRFSTD